MSATVIEGCAIATVDAAGTEHRDGHLVIDGDRIVAMGDGPAPETPGARRIDGRGMLATPGLVNCHHHLYQWATRGLAQQATLFEWLVELYPVWAHVDDEIEWAAARAGLAALARSGCSTTTDHHYVFPAGVGDLLEVEVTAAASIGVRFHPGRGSMDLGRSALADGDDAVAVDDEVTVAMLGAGRVDGRDRAALDDGRRQSGSSAGSDPVADGAPDASRSAASRTASRIFS